MIKTERHPSNEKSGFKPRAGNRSFCARDEIDDSWVYGLNETVTYGSIIYVFCLSVERKICYAGDHY